MVSRSSKPNLGLLAPGPDELRVLLVHAVGSGRVGQVRDPGQQLVALLAAARQLRLRLRRSSSRSCAQLARSARASACPWTSLFCAARSASARSVSERQRASAASSASKSAAAPRLASAARKVSGSWRAALRSITRASLVGAAACRARDNRPQAGRSGPARQPRAGCRRGRLRPARPGPGREHRAGQDQHERAGHRHREPLAQDQRRRARPPPRD